MWISCQRLCLPPGGDQSPESSSERTPRRSPEAAAVGSVRLRRPRAAAGHHHLLDHYLLFCFLLPVAALGVSPGLPRRRRHGPQRRHLVAAGDQPAVDRSHAPRGRGGSLEADVSGDGEVRETTSGSFLLHVVLTLFNFRHQQRQELVMATRVKFSSFKELLR